MNYDRSKLDAAWDLGALWWEAGESKKRCPFDVGCVVQETPSPTRGWHWSSEPQARRAWEDVSPIMCELQASLQQAEDRRTKAEHYSEQLRAEQEVEELQARILEFKEAWLAGYAGKASTPPTTNEYFRDAILEVDEETFRETIGFDEHGRPMCRWRTSVFVIGGLAAVPVGAVLLVEGYSFGGGLIVTVAPFLLLYPVVRAFFGGKDSIGAAATTFIVEEFVKTEVDRKLQRRRRRTRR